MPKPFNPGNKTKGNNNMGVQNLSKTTTKSSQLTFDLRSYIEISRVDHWFKNIFMLFGIVLAFFHNPNTFSLQQLIVVIIALLSTSLIASSNYVINEIKDAPFDRVHPTKKNRAIPSGRIKTFNAYILWTMLIFAGISIAASVNAPFLATMTLFLIMGLLYNVEPIRLKDLPYLDVLSESLNNPIRLLLGWFVIIPCQLPPITLLLAYWFIGSFFMAIKRFSEYRNINNKEIAAQYRKSFRYYDEAKLLTSTIFYSTIFALFFGIFLIRYHFELILIIPLVAGFISYYIKIGFKKNSVVQNPERLYRERGLVIYAFLCFLIFIVLLFVDIPILYEWFNVVPSEVPPLWTI